MHHVSFIYNFFFLYTVFLITTRLLHQILILSLALGMCVKHFSPQLSLLICFPSSQLYLPQYFILLPLLFTELPSPCYITLGLCSPSIRSSFLYLFYMPSYITCPSLLSLPLLSSCRVTFQSYPPDEHCIPGRFAFEPVYFLTPVIKVGGLNSPEHRRRENTCQKAEIKRHKKVKKMH